MQGGRAGAWVVAIAAVVSNQLCLNSQTYDTLSTLERKGVLVGLDD